MNDMKNIIEEKANELYPDNTFSYNGFIECVKWIMEKYQWKSTKKDGYPEYDPHKIFIVTYKDITEARFITMAMDRLCSKNKFYLESMGDIKVAYYMEVPSFDEIIEDNKDVLKRLKDK